MFFRILFLLLSLCLCFAPFAFSAMSVVVSIKGIPADSPLHKNILAHLKLYQQKNNERLQVSGVRRLHRQADSDIRSALAPFGYYNPVIQDSLEEIEGTWSATYIVSKGPPMVVKNIELKLDGPGRYNALLLEALAEFPLKPGKILDQQLYEQGKKRLVHLAFGEGFLDAVFVEHALLIDREENGVNIRLVLQTGERYFFGETICLNPILKQNLLDRYLPYMEGEPYRSAKLFELQAILYKTDYFSRVIVKGLTGKAVDHYIPVEVELTAPEHLNKYTFGAGYATDTGVRGKVDWSNRLFNAKGHKIKVSLQLSELANTIALDYTIPRKDPRYDSFSHILSYQDRKWDDTNTQLFSAGVNRVYKGPRFNYSTGLVIRDEVYDVGNTSGDSTLLIPSLNYGFVFADDIKKTQNGLKSTLGILGGFEGIVSDASFIQFTFGSKMIVTLLDDWRLIGRGALGGTLVDSINDLPPSLRFYAGGDNTIRGYKYKSIGSEDSSGTVIGGRYLVVGSIELERVIVHQWSVAAFWDVGNATDDLSLDFYQGAGIGVRFRLPFGQVKLDLASAVSEDGQPFRVHLTVGGDL